MHCHGTSSLSAPGWMRCMPFACHCSFVRLQGIWDRMKDLARLGAQHYQRPCSGAGINAIIVSESSCLKALRTLNPAIL